MTRLRSLHLIATAALVSGACVTLAPASMAGGLTAAEPALPNAHLGVHEQSRPADQARTPLAYDHMLVGGHAKYHRGGGARELKAEFERASQELGPWDVNRTFYRTLPTTQKPRTPSDAVEIVSYKKPQEHLASFVKSMRDQDMIAWFHEPEGTRDGWRPAEFRAQFVKEYKTAHRANPKVRFGQISGGYQWRAGKRGAGGSFLPPRGSVDWLGFDTYQLNKRFDPMRPLKTLPEFQAWYAKAKTYGVPLFVTEYGRGGIGNTKMAAQRAELVRKDYAYLKSLNFSGLLAWYSDVGPGNHDWLFTDEASMKAWRAISRAD